MVLVFTFKKDLIENNIENIKLYTFYIRKQKNFRSKSKF